MEGIYDMIYIGNHISISHGFKAMGIHEKALDGVLKHFD